MPQALPPLFQSSPKAISVRTPLYTAGGGITSPTSGIYSPFKTPQKTTTATSYEQRPVHNHAFVINWENVLFPMNWMSAKLGGSFNILANTTTAQALQAATAFLQQHSPSFLQVLAAIESQIIQLLTLAMQTGPVFIVSECTSSQVELVASVLFPRLTACLRSATKGIYVLGTPVATELTPLELAAWKINMLQTICAERIFSCADINQVLSHPTSGRFGLVALCANDMDVLASTKVMEIAPHAVVKRVTVRQTGMQLEAFKAQLEQLTAFIKQALTYNGAIQVAL